MTLIAALEALRVGPEDRLLIRLRPSAFNVLEGDLERQREELLSALDEIGLSRRALVLFVEPEAVEITVIEAAAS